MPKRKPFNAQPFAYHQEIELEITTLTNLGSGLGRIILPEGQTPAKSEPAEPEQGSAIRSSATRSAGWVVMVPFTLPGEKVRARVFRNHRNFSEADVVAILTPSPSRVTPPCPIFGRCGGCQYQHLSYAEQLIWKRQQVAELLQHMANLTFPVQPVIGSPREFGYRSKITPHFAPPSRREAEGELPLPIGFLRQGTRFDILDVPHCDIATDAINTKLTEMRPRVRAEAAAGGFPRGGTLLLRDAGGTVVTETQTIISEAVPLGPFGGGEATLLRLRFVARDFFQNNPFILPAFVDHVRTQAAATGAKLLIDAYCGSGLFALASAKGFARENATANGIANASFIAGDAAAIFAGLDFPPADTVVVIDPPRQGCGEPFLKQLFAFAPRAVVYVSCDPATQMRDLVHFTTAGYTLTHVQPFDLFPQTRHLECVITLVRGQAPTP